MPDEALPPDKSSNWRNANQPAPSESVEFEETLPPERPSEGPAERRTDSTIDPTMAQRNSESLGAGSGSSSKPNSSQPSKHGLENAGYEVLDELGRGGMGIVFKARDTKLERTVAVKMILAGQFASEAEIERFRIEGEAAARLDHPGIVPVYEVGEVNGNHFFSMKFVDGGPLTQKREEFQGDPRELVEFLIKIARAVQHAHQRGVLHRDLKPANILISKQGEPMVTDLGLAKRMDDESDLTQTGFAMGTPGFMAPEQAEGRKDITTAADIFSMGAILYWMIAGETPFQGESPMQVVMATIKQDAPSLLAVAPQASRDLDLICQRAMARDPLARYSSAGAFADDLQAWLDGELLSVRAPTAVNVASVWIRKNLRSVLASSSTGLLCGLLVGGLLLVEQLRSLGNEFHQLQFLTEENSSWAGIASVFRHVPRALTVGLEFLIIPVVAVCSFLNVWLVRPTTRDANIVSAATAAFLAGAIAFVVSIGWPAISSEVITRGSRDTQLISNAMWLESETETRLAKQALIQRYPGIDKVEIKHRGDYISRKIALDQETGIMPGLWAAIFRASLWVVVPLGVSSVLSGQLWIQGLRGGLWFGLTWERAAYVFLLAVGIWILCEPVRPGLWLITATLASLMVALIVATRRAPVLLRIAVGVVPTVLFVLITFEMSKLNNAYGIVAQAGNDQEIRTAIQYNDSFLEKIEDQRRRYQSAIAWLYLGDQERYVMHCERMFHAFENAYRPETASRIAKVCLLRPDLQPPENLPTLFSMAQFSSEFTTSSLHVWFCMTKAISDLREGKLDSALEWNETCREKDREYGGRYLTATTYLVDALVFVELGKDEAARQALKQARKAYQETRTYVEERGADHWWENRMVYLIVHEEVKEKLQPNEVTSR